MAEALRAFSFRIVPSPAINAAGTALVGIIRYGCRGCDAQMAEMGPMPSH